MARAEGQKPFWRRDKVTLYSVIAFIVAVVFFINSLFTTVQSTSSTVLIPVFRIASALSYLLAVAGCGLVPIMLIVTSYLTFQSPVNAKGYSEFYGLEVLLLIVASLFLMMAVANAFFNDWLVLLYEGHISDSRYHLAERHIFDQFNSSTYVLFVCQASEIACSTLFESSDDITGPTSEVQLVSNPEVNSISIVANGETVFTHQPD